MTWGQFGLAQVGEDPAGPPGMLLTVLQAQSTPKTAENLPAQPASQAEGSKPAQGKTAGKAEPEAEGHGYWSLWPAGCTGEKRALITEGSKGQHRSQAGS